ncbi:hypothetical protein K474DRAFT_1020296 [Panus rudis PR-1116 ss-1]|nr:hypothetical protein K474DRAFT_1020296 [Panus rudis PR-1116 ss-1]
MTRARRRRALQLWKKQARIPQLIDEVILYLKNDNEALKRCACVSKTFLDASRRVLFAEITFELDYNKFRLEDIISRILEHGHISVYVTDLTLRGSENTRYVWSNHGVMQVVTGHVSASYHQKPPPWILSSFIFPDEVWDCLPRLRSLTISSVALVAHRKYVRLGDVPLTFPLLPARHPSFRRMSLRKLEVDSIRLWGPRDQAFADLLCRFKCDSLHLGKLCTDHPGLPLQPHPPSIPALPVSFPRVLYLSPDMIKDTFIETLNRTVSTRILRALTFNSCRETLKTRSQYLTSFIAPAHSTLARLDVAIAPGTGKKLNLSSFTNLREVTMIYYVDPPPDLIDESNWAALTCFLDHLPTNTITSMKLVFIPVYDRDYARAQFQPSYCLKYLRENVKSSLDPAFLRLLDGLERLELVWRSPEPPSVEDPMKYLRQFRRYIPSMVEADVLYLSYENAQHRTFRT